VSQTLISASVIVVLVCVAIVVVIGLVNFRLDTTWWRLGKHARAHQRRDDNDVSATLAAGVDAGLDALERGPTSDAIIACWLRVEVAAGEVGLSPHPAETAAEFVDRVLGSHGVREDPLRRLAALYREARFSTHAMPDRERDAARECLEAIRSDLAGAHARA
jgi:hypothetical protein